MTGEEIITILNGSMSTVTAVAGSIFTAIFLRNKTATKEFEKLKAGKLQEVANGLLEDGKMSYTEYYRAKNFLKVAQIADEECKKAPHEIHDGNYDFDWFMRFYDAVGNISCEQMQILWAKLLSGEIQHSRQYSLRFIDILKNFNPKEAELFEKICSHCIRSGETLILPRFNNYLEHCSISYSEIMCLDELGLLSSKTNTVLYLQVNSQVGMISDNNSLVLMAAAKANESTKIEMECYPLTSVGTEFASLVNSLASNEDYFAFAKEFEKSKRTKAQISLHRILNRENGRIHYEHKDLLNVNEEPNEQR